MSTKAAKNAAAKADASDASKNDAMDVDTAEEKLASDASDNENDTEKTTKKRKRKGAAGADAPRSTPRARKETVRWVPPPVKPITEKPPIEIPRGKGTPLGEIKAGLFCRSPKKPLRTLADELDKSKIDEVLKALHRILFGRIDTPRKIKPNIRLFNGFDFQTE
ncbi:hypothetical protein BC936DRAFT_140345, partial [Jimgerdemannia flammicorona]